MNKKKILIAVIALVAVIAALVVLWQTTRPQLDGDPSKTAAPETETTGSEETPLPEETFTVIVVHANGTEKTFSYPYENAYLGKVLQEAGLIEGTQEDYGLYMKAVDGERAVYEENGAYWAFYVGEEYALVGIDQTPITANAVYKLVYTKG